MTKPTRAETVGSLLRPEAGRLARRRVGSDGSGAAELRAVEDEAILEAIALQERAGLDVITDGELRRRGWVSTLDSLAGFSWLPGGPGWTWKGTERAAEFSARPFPFVTEPIQVVRDLAQEEYAFLKRHAHGRTKYCIAAPSFHRTHWHPEYSRSVYPTVEDFLLAIRDYIRTVVRDVIALGCDYVQLDAPNYGLVCDPEVRAGLAAKGRDPGDDLEYDAELDGSVFDGLAGSTHVTRALHVCRGNAAGNWAASGGYDPIAGVLFPALKVDRLLLEYDTPRSGDFGALQHVRPDQTVVLGLLTSKEGALEDADAVEGRIHEAARLVPLERLAVSPQCGFASVASGNPLTPTQQQAKLQLVGTIARRVWG